MLLVNSVCTLADVVILDPTQVDFVSWVAFSHGVATTVATQVKDGIYHNEHVFPFNCQGF
jgi:hypothetical protein